MFDMHIKRIHEYKRQLLKPAAGDRPLQRHRRRSQPPAGSPRYRDLRRQGPASAYRVAKLIIKLINDVAQRINHDPRVGGLLPCRRSSRNYGVSLAEAGDSAADLSQQILEPPAPRRRAPAT